MYRQAQVPLMAQQLVHTTQAVGISIGMALAI